MKDLENFKYLPIEQKAKILESEGKFICSVYSHGLKISLYGWEGWYMEEFHTINNNKLVAIRILEDKKRLKFYTKNIDLKTLLNQSILCFLFILQVKSGFIGFGLN
ncbi:MAG: hypothetical protein JWO44_339 [Bacteroidetes bacterium]|jgi:hypothetical protein|nr:hypothetical protein [Bacteroidota bacterium]